MDIFNQKIRPFLASLCLSLMLAAASTQPAFAVHDDFVFELDNGVEGSNAFDETDINDPDDWADPNPDDWARIDTLDNHCPLIPGTDDQYFASCGYVTGPYVDPTNPGGSARVSTFIADPVEGGIDHIFTGGGSKDDLDVSGWQHTIGSPPDKDDLGPVGAAAYSSDDDPLRIYFHGGLYAENGDSSIGMWLFKKNIGLCTSGEFEGKFGILDKSADDGSCTSIATHEIGDVFIVSENTNGGTQTNLTVFMWVGDTLSDPEKIAACEDLTLPETACILEPPKKTLARLTTLVNATCTDANPDDVACGNMNQVPTESPDTWGYTPKSAPDPGPASPAGTDGIGPDDFPAITFFEGGVDLTAIFDQLGCFSSFLMNTRTSASVRSQLKDVAVGEFELCGIDITKEANVEAMCSQGGDVQYTYVITNTGVATVTVTAEDDGTSLLPSFDVIYAATGNTEIVLAPGESNIDIGVPLVVTQTYPTSELEELKNTVVATATSFDGATATASADETVDLLDCSISITKNCTAQIGPDEPMPFDGIITNTGDTPLVITFLQDVNEVGSQDITPLSATLPIGGSTTYSGSYIPLQVSGTHIDTVTVKANAFNGQTQQFEVTANATAGVDPTCVIITNPEIDVTKNCTSTNVAGADILFSGTVTNPGDVDLENVQVTDTYLQADGTTLTTVTVLEFNGILAKAGGSVGYSGSYTPHFTWNKNVVEATGQDVINGNTATDYASAICKACPFVDNPTSEGDSAGSQGIFEPYSPPEPAAEE